MERLECTPWFHVREDGLPVRPGVYEGTLLGKPEGGFVALQGFYLWDGIHWVGVGNSPDTFRRGDKKVTYWRGVIPGKDYPFDQVAKPPLQYSGVLERRGSVDKVSVHRLTFKDGEMALTFTRERGSREPEKYETILHKTGDGFSGSSEIRIGNFTNHKIAHIRVPSFVESGGKITLSLLLQGVTSDWHSFDGVLSSAH